MAERSGMSSSDGKELSRAKMEDLKSMQLINKEDRVGISSVDSEIERSELYLPGESVSFEQELLEKPKLYLNCCDYPALESAFSRPIEECNVGVDYPRLKSAFRKHFHLSRPIEECNVGVVVITEFSSILRFEMKDLVRIVEEAKRRSDFKILLVMIDASLPQILDNPGMQERRRKIWELMEVIDPGSMKAADCAAAYEYIRSYACDFMVKTGLKDFEFWDLVFDRIRGLISDQTKTQNLGGITPPISTKDFSTAGSSRIHKVMENSRPRPMMQQSTSVNDPDWSKDLEGERKNTFRQVTCFSSLPDVSDSDEGDADEERRALWLEKWRAEGGIEYESQLYLRESMSFTPKLLEKPNIYLSYTYYDAHPFASAFKERFNIVSIEECDVGVVIISRCSFTSLPEMMNLVRMVDGAKRRTDDLKILRVMRDESLAELADPDSIRRQCVLMEGGDINARACAAAYEYIRLGDRMAYTQRQGIQSFLDEVFDRICGLITPEKKELINDRIKFDLLMKKLKIHREMRRVEENFSMSQSTSVNDPKWSKNLGVQRKKKSTVDSDSEKGYGKGERTSSHTFGTLPPIPHDKYSPDSMKAMEAPSHGTPNSQGGLQMTDDAQDAQLMLVEPGVKAPLEEEGPIWRRDSSSSTHKDAVEIIKDGFVILGDEISDTIMRDDNLERANDPHGNIEHGFEAFKDQLYEDIKRIDCIEEIAIDGVDTMTLLHSHDNVILSFFDENEGIFEFYFKNREDMASIVGVGLEHAVVIVDSGEVTIEEITEDDWKKRWRSVETNSCKKRKLFKMKMPTSLNTGTYKGVHLDVERSYEKPLLWDLTKYFSLRESIETFVTKDVFVEYSGSAGTSTPTFLTNQGEKLLPVLELRWVKVATNGGLQENANGGFTSSETEEGVAKGSEDTATIVKLQLLPEGYERINDFPGTIKSNLELLFINEVGDGGVGREVHIQVGTVSFKLGRDKNGNQLPWYHEKLRVMFGLLNEGIQGHRGEIKDGSFKSLEMRVGKVNTKTSSTHAHTTGNESTGKGGVSLTPHGVGLSGEFQQKRSSGDTGTQLSERSVEISTDDYTQGGLILKPSVDELRIVCDYSLPKEDASLGPPSTGHFYDQFVTFQGTWSPIGGESPVEYTLIATRDLCHEDKRHQQKAKRLHQQKYTKTMLVNHSMTHLDGKTYSLREQKHDNSKSVLRVVGTESEPGWNPREPLVEMKDIPNEVPDATTQSDDQQQANNRSFPFSLWGIRRFARGSANSHGETSTRDSRQQVNASTSNPTRTRG